MFMEHWNMEIMFMKHVLSHFSRVQLFATLWTVARQAPLSMGSSRQEYWSGEPFPSPGDLLNPGIKPESLTSPALAGGFFTTSATWKVLNRSNTTVDSTTPTHTTKENKQKMPAPFLFFPVL